MRIPVAALLLLATASCGGNTSKQNETTNGAQNGTESSAPATNAAATAQATGARIAALPEAERNATLYRAIHDAGMDCQQVSASQAAGAYRGLPVWNATCQDGGHWTLVVGNDDIVQVLNANEARLVTDQAPPANAASGR